MAKFPSKSGGGDNTGGVRLPSNTDKAIMTRTEDLLNELEQTLAMSIGNVFLNTKATVTNFAQLKGKAAGKSLLLGGLEDIKNSIENVLSTDNKQYKNTYNLIKRSSESLSKLSSENFLPTVIKNSTVKTIDYTDKFDAVIDAVNSSMDKLINLQGSKTESAPADSVKTTSATLDINVSGLDKASLDTMLNLGQLTISKDSMLNANTLHDFSNALASIGSLDINTLPKDVFTYINDSVIPETNRIIEGLSQIDKDIKSKEESIKVVKTFIDTVSSLGSIKDINISAGTKQLEQINNELFSYIKCLIDNVATTVKILNTYLDKKAITSLTVSLNALTCLPIEKLNEFIVKLNNAFKDYKNQIFIFDPKVMDNVAQLSRLIHYLDESLSIKTIGGLWATLKLLSAANLGGKLITIFKGFVDNENTLSKEFALNTVKSSILNIADIINTIDDKLKINSIMATYEVLNLLTTEDGSNNRITLALKNIISSFNTLKGESIDKTVSDSVLDLAVLLECITNNINESNVQSALNGLNKIKDSNISEILSGIFDDFAKLYDGDIPEQLQKASLVIGSVSDSQSIAGIIDTINKTFGQVKFDKNIGKDLIKLADDLKKFIDKLSKSISKSAVDLSSGADKLNNSFKTVDTLFSTIEATNGKAKIAKGSLSNIDSTLGDVEKTAVGAEEKGKKAEKAQVNMANIGKFIMLCGLTMVIGAMFMMIPGMVENALKFGLTLGVFIAAVLLPIALMNKLADPKIFESVAKAKKLIITCGIIMLIGAAVMLIPGITKNTLLFGVTLGLFIAAVLLPIALYGKISGGGISEANQLGKLIVTCSIVMLIGALFVTYANGKLVQACTQFGAVLGVFILMVLAPIMLYNMLSVFAGKSMEHLSKLIVSCTLVMMVGALFITLGGGKFVKAALMFGAVLGVFMLMVLAPLLMFVPLGLLAGWAIRQTEHLITKCVILMMVGALFMMMGGGKLVMYSLAFGLALMAFITLIVTPIILFSFLDKAINFTKVLTSIATFIFVTTIVMIVGALFMQNENLWKNALKFGLLLDAFIIGVLLPVAIYGKLLRREMKSLYQLALFIAVSSACMLVGAMFVKKYGIEPVLEFTKVLGLFVAAMGVVLIAIGRFGKLTDEGYKTMMQLNLLLIVSTACMLIGAAFIQEYGVAPIIEFGTTLIVFSALMGLFLVGLGYAEPYITPGKAAALGIALVIGALSLAIIAMNVAFMLGGGIGNTLLTTGSLILIVGLFSLVCAGLGLIAPYITPGLLVAGGIGIVMTLLGVAIGAMNVAFLIGGGAKNTFNNAFALMGIVGLFGLLFAAMSLLLAPALLGAIAAAAIAIPITLLGIAIGAMNVAFLIGGGAKKTFDNAIKMIEIVGLFGLLFAAMAVLIIPATLGAVAGALIAPPIMLISVALMAMNIALMVGGGAKKSLKNVQMLKTIVGEMPALFAVMSVAGLAAAVAVVAGALLIPAIVLVTSIVTMIGLAGKAYNSAGNINISAIKKSIKDFLSITDVCPNIFKIGAITAKLSALRSLAWNINVIVSYIADSIKQFALLQVATKWDSKGNPIRFKQLKQSDFETAANSVKSVILTLTQAINEVTTKYPWIVKEDSDFNKKLNRVKRLSEVEGEMLSTLCESLQSYAHLLIPTKWDKDGKPIKFRAMVKDDFVNAATGVENVMVTLANAINTTWTNNPKIFTGDVIEKVSDLTTKEGEMLATLSDGLSHYANLMIPDKWNNKGVATHFTPMTSTQMAEAAQNIAAVMTLMACAISLAWDGGTLTLMDGTNISIDGGLKKLESGGFLGFGKTTVKDIMDSLMPMGELVSSLAEGVAQYASLQIPDKWNAKGKPVHYKTILDSDFKTAASNIQAIITCTAKGVAEGYKALNEGISWRSVGSILENIQPLGEVVSSLAEGVAKYAALQIPIKWNANGKPIQFVSLATSENTYNASIYDGTTWKVQKGLTPFGAAAANIQSVITCLGYGVSNAYKAFNDNYDADEFKDIMDGFKSMGDFVSSIATALISYSKLQIANKWNADGKPIGFETMNSNTFAEAGKNISKVVLGILFGDTGNTVPDKKSVKGGLIGAWNILKDDYDPDELTDIINAFVPIGDLISNMAEGLANYAKLQIPTEWDDKGKPVGFRTLTPTDFELAGTNIAKVLSTIANSVITYATENEDLFDGGSDSIFGQTMAAVQGMGEMIKNIADGVNAYATGLIPWNWNDEGKVTEYHHVGDAEYTAAAKNIGTVLGVLGKSVIDFAAQNEDYFDVDSGDSKFKVIMDSVSQMGAMIKDIAEGVNTYAQGGIPIWKDGKIVGYQKWPEGYFDKAGENIKKIITCVGNAVVELYNSDEFTNTFGDSGEFAAAIEAVGKIGNSVKGIADGVQAYANLAIPTGWGKDGKPTGYRKMTNTDITKAKDNIKNMILTLGTAVIDAYNGTNIKDKSLIPLKQIIEDGNLTDIISTVKQISSVVEITAKIVKNIGEFKVPTGFDKDGKAKGYEKLDAKHIGKAKENITSILTNIPTAIYDAYKYNNNGSLFDPSADYIIGIQGTLPLFSDIISKTISLFKNITNNTEHFDKLFTYKQQSTITSDNLTIGLFTDIYAILKDISGLSKVLVEFKDNKKTDIIGAGVDVEILIDVITRFIKKINRFNDIIIKNEKSLSELAKNSDLTSNISDILNKLNTISNDLTDDKLFVGLTTDLQVKISANLANIAALLTTLYSTIQVIATEYNRNIDAINLIYDDNNLFKTKSIKVYTKLTDIAKVFISDDIKSLNNLDKDKNDIIKSLNSVKDVTNTLFATVANIYNVFNDSKTQIDGFVDKNILEGKDKSVKKIISDIDKFASSITTNTNFNADTKNLETLSNVINKFRVFISDDSIGFVAAVGVITEAVNNLVTKVIQEPDTADYLSSRLKPIITDIIESTSILDVLRDSVTAVSVSQVIGETGEALNVLANGLTDVLTAIQGAQVKPQFKQNINELKAFIKESVNTLDSDKASQLTNLILALNAFMEKTGDIQGLTEAITNDLTVALDKITQKLDESNKAYELTERLQKSRHALIDNSIKKISSIMNKEIIVKVTAEMPPTQDAGGTPGEAVDKQDGKQQPQTTSSNSGNVVNPSSNNVKVTRGTDQSNSNGNGGADYASANTLSRIDKKVDKIMSGLNLS